MVPEPRLLVVELGVALHVRVHHGGTTCLFEVVVGLYHDVGGANAHTFVVFGLQKVAFVWIIGFDGESRMFFDLADFHFLLLDKLVLLFHLLSFYLKLPKALVDCRHAIKGRLLQE